MSEDPFLILANELTMIRRDIDKLQRTSLNKEEAEALHRIMTSAVANMQKATKEAPQAIQSTLKHDRDRMAQTATESATWAAERVLKDIKEQLTQEHTRMTQAAGEARRQAWRYFGGFWVWLASMLATGAVLGLLLAYGTETAKAAFSIDTMARYGCGKLGIGGQLIEQNDGSSFCAFWIKLPE